MTIDGTGINKVISQHALTCAHVHVHVVHGMYNFRPNQQKSHGNQLPVVRYHNRKRETPVVLYNTLKIYGTVRSASVIDKLFSLGICVSYLRVLEITKCIFQTLLQQFEHQHVFLPGASYQGIFTVIAKDNIDLNASSTTASNHYHGTSMSILQFPTNEVTGVQNEYSFEMTEDCESLKIDKLPDTYTHVENHVLTYMQYMLLYQQQLCQILNLKF